LASLLSVNLIETILAYF